eukprot:CAMPEP_0114253562 /NCGR_PEP_ID=MMETSP0058-20121206/16462_1 /TAXON_ID=36894 /ORGANISM="Pyramimonas parkeae, CCMP726" /LENGTH=441 /DNA_ID=CAMNT_0001367623 /DNA_START=80 /DNA_END=1405 /DNA_ORIENTATION=-
MGKGGNASTKTSAASQEVLIEGTFYDVTDFKHPGGSIIKFLSGSGADATPSYREFHVRSTKADKYLKSLPQRKATNEELRRASSLSKLQPGKDTAALTDEAKVEALNRDYEQLREDLIKEGFFKPNLFHVAYRLVEVSAMWAVGTYLLLLNNLMLQAVGAVSLALSMGRCGWLMHEGGHYSMTGNIKIDKRFQEFIYGFGCGMSGAWWRNQHNKHHATPQKLQHDVDLSTLPLVSFNTAVTDHQKVAPGSLQALWLKYQAFLFFPVTSLLVGLGWTLFLHPKHSLRTRRGFELASMAARYAVFYASFAPKFGAAGALGLYLACFTMACNYIFCNFAVSHTHLPVSAASDYLHWVVYSAIHTTNISNCWMVNWWMSYLNFQIEHHMFPSMPQFRHPKISPRVKALFEKHGLVYDVRPYWGAMADTFSNLHQVGAEAQHAKAH